MTALALSILTIVVSLLVWVLPCPDAVGLTVKMDQAQHAAKSACDERALLINPRRLPTGFV